MRTRDFYINGVLVVSHGGGLERIVDHVKASGGHHAACIKADEDQVTGVTFQAEPATLEQPLLTSGGPR